MKWIEPGKPFLPAEYLVKWATEDWEREALWRLRRAVFCEEQGVFEGDDRDAIDLQATPIVALAYMGGFPCEVAGTVRIHEAEPGVWWGSRLAVAGAYRRQGHLGAALIRLAVTTAHAQGCHTFLAQVQSRNVPLFRRLHWASLEEIQLHGRPHHLMRADLAWYPPYADGPTGFIATGRRAA